MTIEEVIERIKSIHFRCEDYDGCPYGHDCTVGCLESVQIAIQALEKQKPKKPIDIEEREESIENGFYYLAFVCPSCDEPVIGQPYRPKFCKHCGQKLDWQNQTLKSLTIN